MTYTIGIAGREAEIAALFETSFTASEGAAEGALIGALAGRLMAETPAADLHVVTAREGAVLTGAILFTPLVYVDPRQVALLSPVAVAPEHQGRGIGQALIAHGLAHLRSAGIDVAVTYGDPAFYSRVGFRPVTEAVLPTPHRLHYPQGWQAQSLTEAALTPLPGPARCAASFDDPQLW